MERKLGEMLGERNTDLQGVSRERLLPEGISQIQSHRWQRLFDIPEEHLAHYIAECGEEDGVRKPELPKNPVFQNWGELAQAAANLGVTTEDIFKRAGVKQWRDFASYRDAWNVVEELVTERTQQPKMI